MRESPADALVDPAVGASMRTLRTNLERASREQPTRVLAVTSSLPGEGKTTIAASLAVTLARLESRVLLIDADLRKPGVGRTFGIDAAPGLVPVLRGTTSLEAAERPGPVPFLSIIPTGTDVDAGDLLARNLAEILRRASSRFDVVIVDSPPILVGDDARTIATLCDGVLFVVSADSLAHPVSEAVAVLDGLRVRVLGAVANRTRVMRGLGAYGGYGSYGDERSS
jgi:capsular exopolysaccharide synthesis family protein